ncbi:MAG: DUF488 domain-containing protein [Acidobacteriota bacterium]
MRTKLQLKRVYEQSSEADGERFLIERLWPRGTSKAALADTLWLKDVAPSAELRVWFGHDPERWDEFRRRYFIELKKHRENLSPILEAAREGTVTLLYSSHDHEHNNAVALREFLQHELVPWDPAPCLCLQ